MVGCIIIDPPLSMFVRCLPSGRQHSGLRPKSFGIVMVTFMSRAVRHGRASLFSGRRASPRIHDSRQNVIKSGKVVVHNIHEVQIAREIGWTASRSG
jgi:hypothetical protein